MTLLSFRRKSDISPEDRLDAWLNARTERNEPNRSGRTRPSLGREAAASLWSRHDTEIGTSDMRGQCRPSSAGDDFTDVAQEFHAWADGVQERDPAAKGPADDLWNTILYRQRIGQRRDTAQGRTDHMSTTIGATFGEYAPPRSNRTRKAEASPVQSRSGAWINAIAAALLLLSLGGGAYLMGNGGFGFGGGDDRRRYAAQVSTPEASPDAVEIIGSVAYQADGVCEADPLTEDQVFDIVMNPLNGFSQQGIRPADLGTPETLWEAPSQGYGQRPSDSPDPDYPERNTLHQATEKEAASVSAFVTEYYECLESGTNFQVWGLIMPNAVQERILLNFPVLRSEEQIREFIAEAGPQAYSDSGFRLGHDYYLERGFTLQGNPAPLSLWVNADSAFGYPGVKPDAVILSGVSLVDDSGEVVAAVDYNGRATVLQSGNPGVPETLEIAYFAETNTWYIAATYSMKG